MRLIESPQGWERTKFGILVPGVRPLVRVRTPEARRRDPHWIPLPGGGWMPVREWRRYAAFTAVGSVGSAVNSASSTTLNVARTVGAGNLLVAYSKHEGAATSISVAYSDGSNSFTPATKGTHANNDFHGQFHYLLVAGGGSVTIRSTKAAARTWNSLQVAEYSYTGTASFDVENGSTSTGLNTTSNNITTTGTDEIVVAGYSEYSPATAGTFQINGGAADRGAQLATVTSAMWDKIFTGTFTGAATCVLEFSAEWIVRVVAFKTSAGGGGGTPAPTLMLMGVGT